MRQTSEPTLSEPEAWREIARRIDAQAVGSWAYLCWHIDPGYRRGPVVQVSVETREQMLSRVRRHTAGGAPHTLMFVDGDDESRDRRRPHRVLAALFLALEAEDELAGCAGTCKQDLQVPARVSPEGSPSDG